MLPTIRLDPLESATISPLHAAARAYAEAGIPIFPCTPGDKAPACTHGFHDATTKLEQIDEWWSANPDFNIAFTPHTMGWGVIDIDSREAEEAYVQASDEAEEAWETWTVRTPRGGKHLYYQGELPTSVRTRVLPGEAIDTRGRGSYALLPPSRTRDGTYITERDLDVAPLPEWVAQAIRDTARGGAIPAGDVDLDIPANVDRAIAYLRAAAPALEGQGGDNQTFIVACHLHDLGVSEERAVDLMEPWNERCEPPWDYEELKSKIANAYTYAKNDPGVHAATSAAEAFGNAIKGLEGYAADPLPSRDRFYPEDETEQEEGKEPTWLIPNLIPDSATVMLYGPTQSYKSFLALDLALSTAANIPTFAGAPIRTGPVFYAALEGRTNLKKARRRAWKLARQVEAVPNFYTMPAPMLILPEEEGMFVEAIRKRLDGRRCAGIYLDTLAKIMAGLNENDARDAGQFIRFMDKLAEEFDCPIVAIHHTGRDESHDRGSSSFRAGVETAIRVSADRNARMVTVRVEKHKDAEEREEPWWLEGKQVGQSLVFQAVSRGEYDAATKTESLYSHKRIGAALKQLGAVGDDKAVSSHILASVLVEPVQGEDVETRTKKLASTAKALAKLARDQLAAYVIVASSSGRDPAWALPAE